MVVLVQISRGLGVVVEVVVVDVGFADVVVKVVNLMIVLRVSWWLWDIFW